MKISIKEPCHENWDKMAPNDKGAFCLSCKKNVVDFSEKTLEQVKTFFTELPITENVCGRFREKQLDEMSFDHFLNEFMSWKIVQKAAVICFLIFGATLFSGCSSNNDHTVGELVVTRDSAQIKQCTKDTVHHERKLMGEPSILGAKDTTNKPKLKTVDLTNNKSKHLMGGPMVVRDTVNFLKDNSKNSTEKKK